MFNSCIYTEVWKGVWWPPSVKWTRIDFLDQMRALYCSIRISIIENASSSRWIHPWSPLSVREHHMPHNVMILIRTPSVMNHKNRITGDCFRISAPDKRLNRWLRSKIWNRLISLLIYGLRGGSKWWAEEPQKGSWIITNAPIIISA